MILANLFMQYCYNSYMPISFTTLLIMLFNIKQKKKGGLDNN
jgi:hypothetical protein